MVHDRRLDGKALELRVSGAVKNGNLIMYPADGDSLFLQETGEALEGKRKGKTLLELPKKEYDKSIRWDEWLAKHPKTKVLQCDHCMPRKPKRK